MADPRKVKVLDSYQTLRAVRTAVDGAGAEATTAEALPSKTRKTGAARTRTVVPSKQVIICHDCGYTFQLHGRAKTVPCSKCRAPLDLTDHIVTGKWLQSLKSAATIRIAPDAVVCAGELVGKHVVLDGKLEAGRIRALERLELGPRAEFPEESVSAPDLGIGAGAEITFCRELTCRQLEIRGTLRARVRATGSVTIYAGGLLEGELTATHLRVADGGGLRARLQVTPPA